jgi:hypothetical protein
MMFKVIEMDQRTSEKVAVAKFEGEDAERQAEARAEELRGRARREGRDYLLYWVSD